MKPPANRSLLDELAGRIRRMESPRAGSGHSSRSTASPPDEFPELHAGMLVEWIGAGPGSGTLTLALAHLQRTLPDDERAVVFLDGKGTLYPPGLVAAGIDLRRVLVLRPQKDADALWAGEQALRSPGVAATILPRKRLRSREGRRLKLAVETGGGIGVLVRPRSAVRETCWADLRFLVQPLSVSSSDASSADRRWQIEIAYRRGGVPGAVCEVSLDDETGRLCVVSGLAAATPARRAAGA